MRRCAAALVVLVSFAALSGCSRIIGQPYDNFTAYYNTFYNAQREFDRAEEMVLDEERPVDRDRYLALFPEAEARATDGFENAVEKGADLLREHPESKWVDDALLLIGKAYFYQGNFSGAEQKFRETIALEEDRLEDEARFWLGRTLTSAEQYEDATLTLREGLDREGVREQWADRMRLALAAVDVREGEWEEAAEALRAGIDGVRDDELAARAAFLLGQVYETLGRPADAAAAYEQADAFGPSYEVAYAAQLARALTLGTAGEGETALDLLRRMQRDDKNFDNRAEIVLARARVLAIAGEPLRGRDLLRTLLYDPDPSLRIGTLRGRVHYRLAEIYRDGLNNYVRAAAHYDTAATALGRPDLADLEATPEAIIDADDRSTSFGTFATVAGEIAEMDSLLYLGSLDDEAFAEAVEEIRAQRVREAAERERDLARQRSEQGFRGGAEIESDFGGERGGAGRGGAAGASADAGFLSYRNPIRVQEELVAFQARWGDRPLVQNWRRSEALTAIAVQEGVADELGDSPSIQTPNLSREAFVDISLVPRDPFEQQRMRASRASARYELGNVLFLSLARPDSASVLYRSVIEEASNSPIAQRAYFALAEAQRALGNVTEAERLYGEILDRYPESRFADQARTELGLAPVEQAVVADSAGVAAAAYDEAYAAWQAGEYEAALDGFLSVSGQYPTTPAAARARLAAGALYTEWASGSEVALFASEPLVLAGFDEPPTELPDSLTAPPAGEVFDPAAPADSMGVADPLAADSLSSDSLAVPAEIAEAAEPAAAEASPLGEVAPLAGSDAESGRATVFTWVVATARDSEAATDAALEYRREGYDAYVLPPEDGAYRVGIGQFEGAPQALAVRSALPEAVPEDAEPVEVPAFGEEEAPAAGEGDGLDLSEIAAAPELASDSTAAETEPQPWLETLYASVESDFPGTAFAERARRLGEAVRSLREERAAPAPTEAELSREAGEAGLFSDTPIAATDSTFTWLLLATDDRAAAEEAVMEATQSGVRAALYVSDDEATPFRVLAGQFATEAEAEAVRSEVVGLAEEGGMRVIALSAEAELVSGEDLLRRDRQ